MYYIEKWKAADGWRWRFKEDNGKIMAESGEGYASEQGCDQALQKVRRNFGSAPVWRPGNPGFRVLD
ncbi:MAG TPA: DUF1508 domain-containing protein, partial [Brevundimonas sp.]|nr:DUF1508 domain-containing protein [Brevundimonas sp.]